MANRTTSRKFNPANLPYLAAFAQALQFAHAGYILASWPGLVVGISIGAVVSLSVASAASRIATIAKVRKPLAYTGLIALLLVSPAAIAGASYTAFGILTVSWVRTLTACAWALAPDLAILLSGAIAGKSLVVAEQPAATIQRSASKPKRTVTRSLEFPCRYSANGCGRMFASQNAVNAHARSCKFSLPVPAEWVGKATP
jgi:hypothetical protein